MTHQFRTADTSTSYLDKFGVPGVPFDVIRAIVRHKIGGQIDRRRTHHLLVLLRCHLKVRNITLWKAVRKVEQDHVRSVLLSAVAILGPCINKLIKHLRRIVVFTEVLVVHFTFVRGILSTERDT